MAQVHRGLLRAGLAVLGVALLIPEAGTTSRARDFCASWLDLTATQRIDQLSRSEARDFGEIAPLRSCVAGLRAATFRRLDYECRNWSGLMDFEVRQILDGAYAPCTSRSR